MQESKNVLVQLNCIVWFEYIMEWNDPAGYYFFVYFEAMQALENEIAILIRVSNTEQDAFRILVTYYRPLLINYILSFSKSREKAEELAQDVFVQVWSVRETLPGINNFQGFLYVIARNLALNALRDGLREKARQEKWLEGSTISDVTHQSAGDQHDSLRILDEAVLQLPPQQQKIWIAAKREGKRLAVVAQETGLTVPSIKKYVQLANASIKAFILKQGDILLLISFILKK